MFRGNYDVTWNDFIYSMYNTLALDIVKHKMWENPLALFKGQQVPFGAEVRETHLNPVEAEQYDCTEAEAKKLLEIRYPDAASASYVINRRDIYPISVSEAVAKEAFMSWENFDQFVTNQINTLYSSNYIDEYKYTKELINNGYTSGRMVTQILAEPKADSSAKAFIKKVRANFLKMTFPSSNFNTYSKFALGTNPRITWSNKEDIVTLITADVMSVVDVNVLASAMNMSKADFLGNLIVVDKFPSDKLYAAQLDKSALSIHDTLYEVKKFENARTLTTNYYLHAWGIWDTSLFANAILYASEKYVGAESFTIGDVAEDESLTVGAEPVTVEITTDPEVTTSYLVKTHSADERILVAEIESSNEISLTPVSSGTTTVYATLDNGVTAENIFTVTPATPAT